MDNYKIDYLFAIAKYIIAVFFLVLAFVSYFIEITVHPSLVFLSLSIGLQALAKHDMRQ